MSMGTPKNWLLAALLLALLTWWLRAPLHHMPLERDEGAYAIIAARLLAGDSLYADLFDHKPPLVHLVYALAAAAPADPVVAVRALATLYLLVTGVALLTLAWRLYGRLAALIVLALLLAYGSSWRFQGLSFNSEAVLSLPATLGCLWAVAALLRGRTLPLLWAGVGVGLAALAKPVGLALLGPLLLTPLLARWPWRHTLAGLALATLGVALPLALFGLSLWLQDAVGAANEALLIYNRLYAAESLAQGWRPGWLWRIWGPMLVLALPALLGLLLVTLTGPVLAAQEAPPSAALRTDRKYVRLPCFPALQWRRRRAEFPRSRMRERGTGGEGAQLVTMPETASPPQSSVCPQTPAAWWAAHAVAALWGLTLLATALLSLRPYPHYYLAAVPFLSLWAGAGLARLAGWLALALKQPWLGPVAAGVAGAALIVPVLSELAPLRRLEPTAQISSLYTWDGAQFFAPAAELAAYVATSVPPEQAIFVWAAEPQIYYLSRRRPAARFVYDYPVDRLPGARDELLTTLRHNPPALIVTYHDVRPLGFYPFADELGYYLSRQIGGFDVFERSAQGP
jgi:hypothetical protein